MVAGGDGIVLRGHIPALQGRRLVPDRLRTPSPAVRRRTLLSGTSALAAVLLALAGSAVPSSAQQIGEDIASAMSSRIPADSQMLLEADTLVYDIDADRVTAAGAVRIEYGGNRLVAQRVTYDRKTSRLIASGGVELVDPSGTKVYSDEVDVTDDFANGFVNALRVETADKTYFAAESAERERGLLTTFNNGVYTACAPCEDKPDQAPIWRIKARKIIWNGQSKTVRFEQSRFEFFGFPIATLPAFEIADPTVKRKSGFLFPGARFSSDLGFGASVPYYFALSPTYDLTLTGTGFTKQGFLGEAEWRQQFDNGGYNLKIAGIHQNDPENFSDQNSVNSGPTGDPNKFRGLVASKGRFDLNSRWELGWDVLYQTDKNFARTYAIDGYTDFIQNSEVYLTGLNDRNYFDLRGIKTQVQENVLDDGRYSTNETQPWVLPSFDYSYTPDEAIAGGELNIDLNARSILRSRLDDTTFDTDGSLRQDLVQGIEGNSTRLTAEGEWKRSFVTDGGLVVTPLLAFQADTTAVNQSEGSIAAINALAAAQGGGVAADVQSAYYRLMATAGMELRWPVLFSTTSASHVLEPMAQVFARPDEPYAGRFGIPNEDAQSFVFDAATLFERDKFSGYDRIEGGSRANIGVRYSGTYASGWTTNAIFGQSYQIDGENSFASPDLVHAGAYSGLETDTSDFVGLFGVTVPGGLSASLSGRFDEQTFEVRRAEAKAGYTYGGLSLTSNYAFIQAQPLYGFSEDRHEMSAGSTLRFHQNWRVFGSGTYDFQSSKLISDTVGLGYDDECFAYTVSMSTSRDAEGKTSDERTFGFSIALRTLGDFGNGTSPFAN
ncbi:MAG: LPS-assembly protein LptD [Rhizobiaceae bacterium]|nr:LPS-assembly protein LptD [Rhizobiaceae bacterium]